MTRRMTLLNIVKGYKETGLVPFVKVSYNDLWTVILHHV